MKKLSVLFVTALCLALGMSWAIQPPPDFQALPRSAVVVRIDGRDVTKDWILREAKVVMTLGMNKKRKTKMGKAENGVFRRTCSSGVPLAVNRAVVSRYAIEHSLTNSPMTLKRMRRQVERQYGVRSKALRRWHTLDDLKYMLGKNAPLLDEEVIARATYQTVTNHIVQNAPIVITDGDVTNRMQSIVRYNERMSLTNTLIFARATNVWKRIVGKEMTFEQAATNYSEDVYLSDGCEWGTFGIDQLADDPDVLVLLPTLKVGDITPPVESDGGLAILRLDEVMENKNRTFSRVFFRLPMYFDEETPGQARAWLLEKAARDAIVRELDAMRARMKIEYPSGTNLFAQGCAPMRIANGDLAD